MFYSQVILAKKGPLAKVWLAAHWGDKKLARPQIFATDISQSCTDIMNPSVPLALRLSGHLLLGVVRIYSRKVKYVLNDCTEAMLKLQMAFAKQAAHPKDGRDSRELLSEKDAPTHQLVTNFGDYDQVHVVEGFCLPLPEDNEWILADDHPNEEGGGSLAGSVSQQELLLAAHLPPSTEDQRLQESPTGFGRQQEEETWAPFDPDADDDDDDDEEEESAQNPQNTSRVSDIEVVRAANDSLLSEDQTRRSISVLEKSTLTGPPPNNNVEENYDFDVPFGDNDEESEDGQKSLLGTPAATGPNDSTLQLSTEKGTPLSRANLGDGLNIDEDSQLTTPKRALEESTKQPKKRKRKRRKVVIDNHETELTNEHIRGMLQNTNDIVRSMIHPASLWDEEDNGKDYKTLVLEKIAKEEGLSKIGKARGKKAFALWDVKSNSAGMANEEVPCLTRPFLADDSETAGGPKIHPVLHQLWQDNYWKPLGNPCSYERLEKVEDVEQVRKSAEASVDDDESAALHSVLEEKDTLSQSNQDMPVPSEEMDFPPQVEDDEDSLDPPIPDMDDDENEDLNLPDEDENEDEDLLELGMVNDMVLDSDENDDSDGESGQGRQALGEMASSSTKWHKHTVRVFSHLKKCLKDTTEDSALDEKPEEIRFQELTKNVVSRRNASSVFFELLQLKTWDFIEVDQDQAYGDITISAGIRFGEDAPNN